MALETNFGQDRSRLKQFGYDAPTVDRKFFEDFDQLLRRAIVRNTAVAMYGLDEVF